MKKIALYCRSAIADNSKIEAQKQRLIDFAGGDCVFYIDSGASGNPLERPLMSKLNADIRSGLVKTVVAVDVSRICRDYVRFSEWLEFLAGNGVGFVSLEEERFGQRDSLGS
ncbi:MAG: recombinase family protein [Oscillospiraceae bacterium]|nr:recombinase family protein [Oscillospiraceae bacterium]